jgi:PAS domain S-box-containing protein
MKSNIKSALLKKDCSDTLVIKPSDQSFTFFLFNNHASVEANDSVLDVSPGTIFLRSPGVSLDIKPLGNYSLCYTFLAFLGPQVKKIVNYSCIDTNILLKPLQIHFADSIFTKIETELSSHGFNWKGVILAHFLELLSKSHRLCNHNFTEILPDHAQKLRDLRSEIHEDFSKPWKIDDMAEKMNLSTSRFASLYKSTFKISPTEDLIQTRIDQAKKMLSGSKVSVKKVSEACGFESVHYFHRAFKKRANLTPKHFQNSQFAQEGSVYTPERHFSLDLLTQQAEYSGIIEMIDGELRFHGNTKHVSELLGYTQEELRNRPFLDFVAPEDANIAQESASKILKNKNILGLNIRLLHNTGKAIPVQFTALLKGQNWYWFIKHAAVAIA